MRGPAFLLLLVLIIPAAAMGQALQAPSADQGRLHADHVRYDAKAKVYLAEGNAQLILGDVEVRAQRLRLEQNTQTLYAFGDVHVMQGDVALTAVTITYDLRRRIAHALGNPILVQGVTSIRAERMEFDLGERQTFARGGVIVTNKDLRVNAPEMRFDASSGEALATDVVVSQPGRAIRARQLRYLLRTGRLELDGSVVVEQESGERLVEEGAIEAPSYEEGRRPLSTSARLTCDRLIILAEEHTVQAEGSVTVTQEGRSASATAAVYSDQNRRLMMIGDVVLQDKDGSRLRADLVIISLVGENIEATGNVVTEFSLKLRR
jgi:lipopolysaccharide transport protein LptA